MIEFKSSTIDELTEEYDARSAEICVHVLNSICKGIDENLDYVMIGFLPNLNMDIAIYQDHYIEALELNIAKAAEIEEFELCAKAYKYLNTLKKY